MRKEKRLSHKLRKKPCYLTVVNCQRQFHVDMSLLWQMGTLALPSCLDKRGGPQAVLPYLSTIEVSIVSDDVISLVHKQFLGIDSTTDVITFPYGEMMISAETTSVNSRFYGHSPTIEIAICLIHGLLHLNGYNDHTALQAEKMIRRQTMILQAVLSRMTTSCYLQCY